MRNICYTTAIQDIVLKKASKLWSETFQKDMAQEEAGELIIAISHYRRGRVEISAVLEEVADVLIVCRQLMLDHMMDDTLPEGEDAVSFVLNIIDQKMERLQGRVLRDEHSYKPRGI